MKSIIIIFFIGLSTIAQADIFESISNAVKAGNAQEISKYFNTNVELTILNQEEVYSKTHAEQLLRDFFNKNHPQSFTIIHQGLSKDGAKFAIGKMTSSAGVSFRFYILIRQSGSNENIQELRIEKE